MMITVEGPKLHEFRHDNRKAEVYKHNKAFVVRMYNEKGIWLEDRIIKNHSERYAEDCAENFVMGLIHAEV